MRTGCEPYASDQERGEGLLVDLAGQFLLGGVCDSSCFVNSWGNPVVKNLIVAAALTTIFIFALNARAEASPRLDASGNEVQVIGGRPAGCPHAYCGCGLRKFLGLDDKRLNLAWNWARLFPRTQPRPRAAAVRRHHVMLLISHVQGSHWLVRDYNSGGGLSRIHVRDVRGFVFVSTGTSHEYRAEGLRSHYQANARPIRRTLKTRFASMEQPVPAWGRTAH